MSASDTLDLAGYTTVWNDDFASDPSVNRSIFEVQWGNADEYTASNGGLTMTDDGTAAGFLTSDSGASSGNGYGLYSVTFSEHNAIVGDYIDLWPGTNVWPGPEIDLYEQLNGQGYCTVHWEGAGDTDQYQSFFFPSSINFTNHTTVALDWQPGSLTFYANGQKVVQYTSGGSVPIPTDYAHGGQNEAFGVGLAGGDNGASVTLYDMSYSENDPVCYLAGTRILTPSGEVPVERLRTGDLVVTVSGTQRALRWIGFGRTIVTPRNRHRATPVVIRRHALAEYVPRHDLYLTRGHSLYLERVLIPVEELINYRTITWAEEARVVEYYHLELDSHDVVLAEGVAAETYCEDDNSPLFHNAATRPPTSPMPRYAPVLHNHPTVRRVWHKLNERAGRPDLTLTDDPDLHLLADGQRLDAEMVEQTVWRFRLPGPVADLRIVSRSAIPSMIGIAQDQRRLGVALRRIVLMQPGLSLEVGWENDSLIAGFYGPEPIEHHRWTDGEGVMPTMLLPCLRGDAIVDLYISGLLPYPLGLPETAERAAERTSAAAA